MSFLFRDIVDGKGLGTKKASGQLVEVDTSLVRMVDPRSLGGKLSGRLVESGTLLVRMFVPESLEGRLC